MRVDQSRSTIQVDGIGLSPCKGKVCEVRKRKVLELDPKEDRVWDDVKVGHSVPRSVHSTAQHSMGKEG